MNLVFGGSYHGDINLNCENVVSILATASFLQIQDIINKCVVFMKKTIYAGIAITYHKAATFYDIDELLNATKQWLVANLVNLSYKNYKLLKDMTPKIMTDILSSSDLVVCHHEFDIYDMLRDW